jgi:hydroxyacylglutathione hydrolase
VDVRSPQEYAAGHVPNAVNIGLEGEMEAWVGALVPLNANLVLYGSRAEVQEGAVRLQRVGFPARAITPEAWEKGRLPLAKSECLKPEDLKERLQGEESPMVVDVGDREECATGAAVGRLLKLPLLKLGHLAPSELDPGQPVVAVGDSPGRASLAVGLLERLGFKKAGCLDGGRDSFAQAGLPAGRQEDQAAKPQAESSPRHLLRRVVRLPQRISPADLKRSLEDLPGTFDIVDIRPPEAFGEFNLPGSINVDVAEVMQNALYLRGAGPLILVDRDGSLAMAVGGVLSQKTWRPVKVLHGGLEAYTREFGLKLPAPPPAGPEPPVKAPPAPGAAGEKPGG